MDLKDKDIKTQLSQREIYPSAAGWDKLEGTLNQSNYKKSKRFLWIGIAASFLVGLFISYFAGNEKTQVKMIYLQEKQNIAPTPVVFPIHTPVNNENIAESIPTQNASTPSKQVPNTHAVNPQKHKDDLADFINQLKEEREPSIDPAIPNNKEDIIVTEAEQLLANAMDKDFGVPATKKNKSKISATQLLWSAEQKVAYEEDKTFLERSFEYAQQSINKGIRLVDKNRSTQP